MCVHVCKHVCSLCLSVCPSVHDVHTNEGFGYTPSLSGLLHVHKCKHACLRTRVCFSGVIKACVHGKQTVREEGRGET